MIGQVKDELGLLFQGANYKVVKKAGKAGDKIDKHNHPEAEPTFIVVKGKVKAYMNEEEEHILEPGKVLNFNGDNYINAEFLEDGEVVIVLASK